MLYGAVQKFKEGIKSDWKSGKRLIPIIEVIIASALSIAFIVGVINGILSIIGFFRVPAASVDIASSTILAPINSPTTVSVSGTGNATAVGPNSLAIAYPPPTLTYQWVERYTGTPSDGIYREVFVYKLSYPDNENVNWTVVPTSPFVSCAPTPPNSLPSSTAWAMPKSFIDLTNSNTVNIVDITCTSTLPIVDNGTLFTYAKQ